jgi:two-component system response regulator RegA
MNECAVQPRLLLLVEPDKRLRERLASALRTHGCEVRVAGAIDEADLLTESHVFDYAVIEPGLMQGAALELIRKLKSANSRLRTLFFSPFRTSAAMLQSLQNEGVSCLRKPADTDEVLSALGLLRSV